MNQQQRAVVQQALEALEFCQAPIFRPDRSKREEAITALRQLLEQPEPVQEPQAFLHWYDNAHWGNEDFKEGCHRSWNAAIKYTTPPEQPAAWVGLTDEQANLLINGRGDEGDDDYVEPTGDGFGLTDEDLVKLIRRVEAHHGIGAKP